MRAVIVWRRESDYGRVVEDWIRDFSMLSGMEIETIDPDDAKNEGFLKAYDVVEYPMILGLDDNGKVMDSWRGLPLPRLNEVAAYANPRKI